MITPIFPITGQKFSRYFEVHLYIFFRYFETVMYLFHYFSRNPKRCSVEPCLTNTALVKPSSLPDAPHSLWRANDVEGTSRCLYCVHVSCPAIVQPGTTHSWDRLRPTCWDTRLYYLLGGYMKTALLKRRYKMWPYFDLVSDPVADFCEDDTESLGSTEHGKAIQ